MSNANAKSWRATEKDESLGRGCQIGCKEWSIGEKTCLKNGT